MKCHDEILDCARQITGGSKVAEFSVKDVIQCMKRKGSQYAESSIQTGVTSRLCKNAPNNHASNHDYFERVGPGRYRLIV